MDTILKEYTLGDMTARYLLDEDQHAGLELYPTHMEGKPPRDPRNGGNLEAWDLTRVWRHGWIRADTSHDDMP